MKHESLFSFGQTVEFADARLGQVTGRVVKIAYEANGLRSYFLELKGGTIWKKEDELWLWRGAVEREAEAEKDPFEEARSDINEMAPNTHKDGAAWRAALVLIDLLEKLEARK